MNEKNPKYDWRRQRIMEGLQEEKMNIEKPRNSQRRIFKYLEEDPTSKRK